MGSAVRTDVLRFREISRQDTRPAATKESLNSRTLQMSHVLGHCEMSSNAAVNDLACVHVRRLAFSTAALRYGTAAERLGRAFRRETFSVDLFRRPT
mgnify:CR=1 FL=1